MVQGRYKVLIIGVAYVRNSPFNPFQIANHLTFQYHPLFPQNYWGGLGYLATLALLALNEFTKLCNFVLLKMH